MSGLEPRNRHFVKHYRYKGQSGGPGPHSPSSRLTPPGRALLRGLVQICRGLSHSPAITVWEMAFGNSGDLGTATFLPRASPITWTVMAIPHSPQGSCTQISLLPMSQMGKLGLPAGSGPAGRAETAPRDPAQPALPTLAPLGKILESGRPCLCAQRLVRALIFPEAQTPAQAGRPQPATPQERRVGVSGPEGTGPHRLLPCSL